MSSFEVDTAGDAPAHFNFAVDVVDRWAEDVTRVALIQVDSHGGFTPITYADISRRSGGVAQALREAGVGRGDPVVVMLPRIAEWQIAMIACLRIGALPIPSITMLTPKDLEYRCSNSGAVGVITSAAETHKFRDIGTLRARIVVGAPVPGWVAFEEAQQRNLDEGSATVAADDPAILYYTSGSTGLPKGVVHAARALYLWRRSAHQWLTLGTNDVIWCTADTGWSKAGTSILFGPWSMGSAAVMYDGPFDVEQRFEILRQAGVTVFCAAATELRRLIQSPNCRGFERLRLTVSAGESVNPDVVLRWRELTGSDLLDGYGQTETLMTITNRVDRPVKPGSMGKPLVGVDAGVLTLDGDVRSTSATGQLVIRGDSSQLMLGYHGEPDRTSSCFVDVEGERWFQTGDNVTVDDEGYYFYVGRVDDVINSSGYRIGPQEVENALVSHPAVVESAVVGAPDEARGEVVVAFVVLAPPFEASDELIARLQDHVKAVTAPYKYPRRVLFVGDLPKTITGKIRRNVLRESLCQSGSC